MPEHYSKSTQRHEDEAKAGRVFDCVWLAREKAFNSLMREVARYGAATNPREKKLLGQTVKQSIESFYKADRALLEVVGAEDSLMIGRFLQQAIRKFARPGSRWSADKRTGYEQAMSKIEELVRDVVQRASAVAEIRPQAKHTLTIGERAAIAQAERDKDVEQTR